MRLRLDNLLSQRDIVPTRSQAESYIKLGLVRVNGNIVKKPGVLVDEDAEVILTAPIQYVSRAAMKLESVVPSLSIDFTNNVVMDVGSSTGGFTQYALLHGAKKIFAIDVGKNQLHPSLRGNKNIELYEQTDIRDLKSLSTKIDLILVDVSFISVRQIIPSLLKHMHKDTRILVMVKPQFEVEGGKKHKGVIKNNKIRRQIFFDFEKWVKNQFMILNKAESKIPGEKGNIEKFYLLQSIKS